MPKVLTISGFVVALLVLLIFGLDLALGIPFNKTSMAMDIAFVLCGIGLGYMSWMTFRQQV